ncbi:hypothetical protein ONE63_009135 [Megalurothrips usitatus]|uniref:THAP-type domain-containing protein n=1 Tax=Megalurothrips usitatus TaxID=439358 RepID=A0AAV7XK58_9NEOP|nr:hypothetical protein ONE63_009135 [Megalurothrips usitatus]
MAQESDQASEGPAKSAKSKRYCCVRNCKAKQGKMYAFPKHAYLREQWRLACGITREVTRSMHVCGRHFKSTDQILNFECQIRLRQGARPTLFLPPPEDATEEETAEASRKCAVPSCRARVGDPDARFHCCPKSSLRRKLWQEVIGRKTPILKSGVICSRHFTDKNFFILDGKPKLRGNVVPSLNLLESPRGAALEDPYEEPLFVPRQDVMVIDDFETDPLFIPSDDECSDVKQDLTLKHESDVEL